jgi:exodeoxyribonuclease VII large subunit
VSLERKRASLDAAGGRLRALSPRSTLQRGYAIVRASGRVVSDASTTSAGDRIGVELARGRLGARVEEVES